MTDSPRDQSEDRVKDCRLDQLAEGPALHLTTISGLRSTRECNSRARAPSSSLCDVPLQSQTPPTAVPYYSVLLQVNAATLCLIYFVGIVQVRFAVRGARVPGTPFAWSSAVCAVSSPTVV